MGVVDEPGDERGTRMRGGCGCTVTANTIAFPEGYVGSELKFCVVCVRPCEHEWVFEYFVRMQGRGPSGRLSDGKEKKTKPAPHRRRRANNQSDQIEGGESR